jgi:hypothetical protein
MSIKTHSIQINYTNFPKKWYPSQFGNDLLNSFNLLFPDAEKFFVRTVKQFLPKLSKSLQEDAKGFIGQETMHSNEHEKLWSKLREQGYEIDGFIHTYRLLLFENLEKFLSPEWNLALTAGLEHYTAMLADFALEGNLLEEADVDLKELYEWHCAEEIDHKSVAYSVLNEINPNYFLRCGGMLLASFLLLGFSSAGVIRFILDDKRVFELKTYQEVYKFFFDPKYAIANKSFKEFIEYFKFDFHPSQKDNSILAKKVFDRLEQKKQSLLRG